MNAAAAPLAYVVSSLALAAEEADATLVFDASELDAAVARYLELRAGPGGVLRALLPGGEAAAFLSRAAAYVDACMACRTYQAPPPNRLAEVAGQLELSWAFPTVA